MVSMQHVKENAATTPHQAPKNRPNTKSSLIQRSSLVP